ncbi:unnamed protein product [Cyprideis torosa]|uniref:DUF1835 domain-containing protein n=1 Tax=Cyprideis torosa TaxID=163714 RepID=A0A7R8WXN6_9CRUS|nr:unnamed protein product [Cyprideis torosa]CAG0908791.1 unnamed protein product [Cyprideis torosa]
MSDHVYKTVEVTGSSSSSSDDAIRTAIKKASESIHNLNWFEVIETRGHIDGADVSHWQAAGIEGTFLPWRDLLHEGPVPAKLTLPELFKRRTSYLSQEGYSSHKQAEQHFQHSLSLLADLQQYARVILWFEHDLYDQLQLLQILDHLGSRNDLRPPVELIQTDEYLGCTTVSDIPRFQSLQTTVTPQQMEVASVAWQAFRHHTPEPWIELLTRDTHALPHLHAAIERLLEEYPDRHTGLNRTQRTALSLIADGHQQPGRLFGEYQKTEQRRFLGDLSFWRMLRQLMAHEPGILQQTAGPKLEHQPHPEPRLEVTALGREILQGIQQAKPFDQGRTWWLGGVTLSADNRWYWNPQTQCLEHAR